MKYSNEIVIRKPLSEVLDKFDSFENLKHWQPGFVGAEHLEGEVGQEGAKSKLTYIQGKRRIEMVETIRKRNLPEAFNGTYHAKGMINHVDNSFQVIDENSTRWISHNEFIMSGFMKVMGWLMPGMFKKQSLVYMNNFKAFVEEGVSVQDKK
jgi:hypothetical protein